MDTLIQRVAGHLEHAHRLLFVTGAGLSADSGLPTYRGIGGLYDGPNTDELPIEVLLSGPMYQRDPSRTWKYISQLEAACRGAEPNRGHRVIANLETSFDVVVLTQNVDGLHHAAGSSRVIEIHGALRRLRCPACTWRDEVSDYAALEAVPRCPICEGIIRPDVVLFEEMLPEVALDTWSEEANRGFDMVFSVGTSSLFPYIIEPVWMAAQRGLPTVEINPASTDLSSVVDVHLQLRAAEALDALAKALGLDP
ncbi:MAG: NAD-dependent deacetylase [Myxococcota bacterium]